MRTQGIQHSLAPTHSGAGSPLSGRFAAFFKSFFTTKRKPGRPPTQDPYRGDVVKNADGEPDGGSIQGSVNVVKGGNISTTGRI